MFMAVAQKYSNSHAGAPRRQGAGVSHKSDRGILSGPALTSSTHEAAPRGVTGALLSAYTYIITSARRLSRDGV